MTAEELAEIERDAARLADTTLGAADFARRQGAEERLARWAPRLVADYRASIELAEHIQADLAAATRANACAEATIADLREDLARARLINTQAEKVRDENERLRRDLATVREELQALSSALSEARAVTAAEGRAEK